MTDMISKKKTYKRDAGGQQQDPDKQVLKLLSNQLPDALTWARERDTDKRKINVNQWIISTNYKCKKGKVFIISICDLCCYWSKFGLSSQ